MIELQFLFTETKPNRKGFQNKDLLLPVLNGQHRKVPKQ